jgi:hypothetical protein
MNQDYRQCGIDLCGFCFDSKHPKTIRCEYLPTKQPERFPEQLEKGRECKYKLIKINSN